VQFCWLSSAPSREGHDVVLPQLVTTPGRGPGFEEAARAADATYVEVALLVDHEEHLERLHGKQPTIEIEARIQTRLEDPDSDLVERIRRHLAEYLTDRTIRLNTTGPGPEASSARLLYALCGDVRMRHRLQ
jgi:hypothetical protein